MESFSEWMTVDEAKRIVPRKVAMRPKKQHAAVPHTDIDRWLKSVDGLAKDLKDLQGAKKNAEDKMKQIGQKYKPEDADKPEEKPDDKHDKHDIEKSDDRKPIKRPRPDSDREVLPSKDRKREAPPKRDKRPMGRAADDEPIDSPKTKRERPERPERRRPERMPVPEDEDME